MESTIKSLFDIKFETYITPAIAGIFMIVTYAMVTVMWVTMIFQSGIQGLIMAIVGIPVSFVFIRMWFEGLVSLVKTAEASTKLVKLKEEELGKTQS